MALKDASGGSFNSGLSDVSISTNEPKAPVVPQERPAAPISDAQLGVGYMMEGDSK